MSISLTQTISDLMKVADVAMILRIYGHGDAVFKVPFRDHSARLPHSLLHSYFPPLPESAHHHSHG